MSKNRLLLLLGSMGGLLLLTLLITWISSVVTRDNSPVLPSASIAPEQIEFEVEPDYSLLEPAPSASPIVVPPTSTININGVEVQNFYSSSQSIDSYGTIEMSNNDNFTILYYPNDHSFSITINNSPFETHRQQAETVLLATLNIPEAEACKLLVSIATPEYANPAEAGTNYPLSFCPENN